MIFPTVGKKWENLKIAIFKIMQKIRKTTTFNSKVAVLMELVT